MKISKITLIAAIAATILSGCSQEKASSSIKVMNQVDFSHVVINDNFWSPRLEKHASATLAVCIDQIENQTGRISNFENAAKGEGKHSGIFFDDSDVYKALEGMAYSLINNPNPELEQKCDEWIDKFAAAQQPDGYINTYYTLTGLENRWVNMDKHEMYCAGHMIEAAVAYYQATGKRKLIDVSEKMVEHMMSVFGPGKRDWVPGHEEIELALVKLYGVTGKEQYVEFADWLLSERGHGHGQFAPDKPWNPIYYQDEMPVREMADIAGHAVRCMYLYCGMADVAALKNDEGYIAALNRLWDDVTNRHMYITGGIGSSAKNEGFTDDYDLPNKSAYCETCASVGMVLWNSRMNALTGDSKYIDILERSMYNGALAGISLSGDRFFYVNPLESEGNHHRKAWYGCACCPSQMCRFLPSIGSYIYAVGDDAIWVNLYIGNSANFKAGRKNVSLKMETDYPWNGDVKLTAESATGKALKMRIPGWCKSWSIAINGEAMQPTVEAGYAVIPALKKGDTVVLSLDMPVEVVAADPRVKEDEGKRAIQRGPLVYCMEQIDNVDSYDSALVSENMEFSVASQPEKLGGIMEITAMQGDKKLTMIPYYSWDNREAGPMKVWINLAE